MRKIARIDDNENRRLFTQYLFFHGIESHVDENNPDVWVIKDDQKEKAKNCFQHFTEVYLEGSFGSEQFLKLTEEAALGLKKMSSSEKEEREKEKKWKAIDFRKKALGQSGFQIFSGTGILIAFSAVIFLLSLGPARESLYRLLLISQIPAFNPFSVPFLHEVRSGEVWRLLSPVFLHHDFFHIIFNMMWLYQLGTIIEKKEQTFFFLVLVILIGVFSNLAFYFVSGPRFGGMSGVIYGFLAYLWAYKKIAPMSDYFLDEGLVRFFVFWYVFCWFLTVFGFGVANTVHGVGALSGGLLGFLRAYQKEEGVISFKRLLSKNNLATFAVILVLVLASVYIDAYI